MLPKNFQNALKIVAEKMAQQKVEWVLVGSANCALQGMEVGPKDLDVIVKLKNLQKVSKIFEDYTVSPIKKLPPIGLSGELAWEIKIEIDNVSVHILGERNPGEYVSKLIGKRIVKIKIGDITIPCFTLDAEADTYVETNRLQKAEKIREFLRTEKWE